MQELVKISFITSFEDSNACVRLHSGAVVRGAVGMAGLQCSMRSLQDDGRALADEDCIGFHYNDLPAIERVRQLARGGKLPTTVCFGADIYAYDKYTALQDITSLFVMPTERHRRVLAGQISTPIFTLSEAIDPLALSPDTQWTFPIRTGRRVGWFGYPESFYKGMHSLLPSIRASLAAGHIDGFSLVTDTARFANDQGYDAQHFSAANFRQDVAGFDYTVLSHFPLDLMVNSLIKSPNKAVTALMAGCIPLVSDTDNYRDLMTELGLQRFIFGSPRELAGLLQRLDPAADSALIRSSGAIEKLRSTIGDAEVARSFMSCLASYHSLPHEERSHEGVDAPQSYAEFARERVRLVNRVKRFSQRKLKRAG